MLKQIISYLLLPFPAALLLLLLGLVFLWFTTRQRIGKVLASVACSLLLLFSCQKLSGWYSTPLKRFAPLPSLKVAAGTRWIVVLGGGYSNVSGVPATSRLSAHTLQRLVEAVRLYRTQPGTKLIVSGGIYYGATPQADVMAEAAEELGVPSSDIVRESGSDDTQDEARLVHEIVHADPFVLVTSAMHMRRSMRLFEKQGMKPIPAPAGFWPEAPSLGWSLVPSSGQLTAAEAAEHEHVGTLWSRLRGTL